MMGGQLNKLLLRCFRVGAGARPTRFLCPSREAR
jgi:hypothetical protein